MQRNPRAGPGRSVEEDAPSSLSDKRLAHGAATGRREGSDPRLHVHVNCKHTNNRKKDARARVRVVAISRLCGTGRGPRRAGTTRMKSKKYDPWHLQQMGLEPCNNINNNCDIGLGSRGPF
jgi:hypothetical protein